MNQQERDRELDIVKSQVFRDPKNAAFLGSLMGSMNFTWDDSNRVGTNGKEIRWGRQDFDRCSRQERILTLFHELWHKGLLHHLRQGSRELRLWNIACDLRINNNMRYEGRDIPDYWVVDPSIDRPENLAEEDIYDLLQKNAINFQPPPGYQGDLDPSGEPEDAPNPFEEIAAVVRAVQAAQMAGQAGNLPGQLKQVLDQFLHPQIDWDQKMARFFTDICREDYTWSRPNRRYDIYLPSLYGEGKLDHLAYCLDVSGSITDKYLQIFHSEFKYILETLQPARMTLLLFDTKIQKILEFQEGDTLDSIEIVGRGGTSLVPVREWLNQNAPTAAVVFTDLYCAPMEPLTVPTEILWAVVDNPEAEVPFGEIIHITEKDA